MVDRRRAPRVTGFIVALLFIAAPLSASRASPQRVSDPFLEQQWALEQIRVPDAWNTTTGKGTTVAVIDDGIDVTHPEFAGRLTEGRTFIECGAAGCGDGTYESGDDNNDNYHGTFVAGIIGARRNNGLGIAGVAPKARLMPLRVFPPGSGGADAEDVARAVRWATDHGADVINLSLGNLPGVQFLHEVGFSEPWIRDAVRDALDKGVVIVAAAGNETFPLCATPAYVDGVICVTATDRREAPAAYTNGGVKPDMLTMAAPGGSLLEANAILHEAFAPVCGEGVLSTVPPMGVSKYMSETCGWGTEGRFMAGSGTSASAPHVAGVAALIVSLGCPQQDTVDILIDTARLPGDVRGHWSPLYGFGIVDATAAVREAATRCANT